MRTRRILIVFATHHGQTARVAEHMRAKFADAGFDVTVANVDMSSVDIEPEQYDAVLVGGSLMVGRHQRSIKRYVTRHLERLNAMPSAFFSLSGSAASADPQGQADARTAMQRFLTETRWDPDMMTTVAGAIMYTKYGWLTRMILREICRRAGGPTDTSRDHELTDWAQVSAFAIRFAHVVSPVAPPGVLSHS
jgi:menaquinone-dependent protoporphyrinogen oxidase